MGCSACADAGCVGGRASPVSCDCRRQGRLPTRTSPESNAWMRPPMAAGPRPDGAGASDGGWKGLSADAEGCCNCELRCGAGAATGLPALPAPRLPIRLKGLLKVGMEREGLEGASLAPSTWGMHGPTAAEPRSMPRHP